MTTADDRANSGQLDDPLDQLFVTGEVFDRQLVADILSPYIRIYVEGGGVKIVFTQNAKLLGVREKLLAYLLAIKAVSLKDEGSPDSATPGDIEKETGLVGGTIRPILRRLLDEHLVTNIESGRYTIPAYALETIGQILKERLDKA